eukprot:scaffold2073_cov133-Skeletonema_marinoi.AAC.2
MSSYKKKGGSSWNPFAGGVGSGGFGGGGGPNNNNNNNGGVGYAGGKDDQRKLVAGRKKAVKESKKEDKSTTKSLKMMNKSIQKNLAKHCGLDDEIDLSHSSYDALAGLVDTDDRGQVKTILADVFRNQVPTDWDTRKALYTAALDLTNTLVSDVRLAVLLGDEEDQETVLYWLKDFSQQCSAFMKRHEDNGWSKEDEGDVLFATRVKEVADKAIKISKRCLKKPEEELVMIDFSTRYQGALGPLRFDTVDSMNNHYFLKKVPNAPSTLNTRQLFKELTAYRTALPVEYGSSCFCRVINDRLDLLRVMITGPDETPYANGCFFFDVNLTGTYPKTSPAVQFLTTGGGKYRFNPNLYNCGKVCLSLLGTWQGPGWVSGQSTLLQVLISIQSLILVPDPYYNEPGWAHLMNTPQGNSASNKYNRNIRHYTLSAAIESHLSSILNKTNPYPEFESVMKKHFLEKRFLIENELRTWANEDMSLTSRVTNICKLLAQLAGGESKKTTSRSKRKSEPIVLDGADYGKQKKSKKNETIEIDLLSDDEGDKKPSAKPSSNDVVDLT